MSTPEDQQDGEGQELEPRAASPIAEREWDLPWKGPFLYALSLRPIVSVAARQAGINRQYAYEAAQADPEFAAAWREARIVGKELLEQVAWRRATSGEERQVTTTRTRRIVDRRTGMITHEDEIETTVVDSTHVSDTLVMFMLKKLDPSYRERADIRVGALDDSPVHAQTDEVFRTPTRTRMLELLQIARELELPIIEHDPIPGPDENGSDSSAAE